MELGNIIFGNSRGQAEIPREDAWSEPLQNLLNACDCGERGYPGFDNATFTVRGYDWDAECDCGFGELAEQWHAQHPHAPECYDSVMAGLMAAYDISSGYAKINFATFGDGGLSLFNGMNVESEAGEDGGEQIGMSMMMTPRTDAAMESWRIASDARHKFEDESRKRLCKERGLSYPAGCAVHCDCYKAQAADDWFSKNDHTESCRSTLPNFLFKPTGFKASWYKYPLRDSYMTPPVSADQWRDMMAMCEASLTASH